MSVLKVRSHSNRYWRRPTNMESDENFESTFQETIFRVLTAMQSSRTAQIQY